MPIHSPPDPSPVDRVWCFGSFALDERTQELRRDGQLLDIERKPLEVLLHLLSHSGEVVTKDELAEAVWPGRILTESVLTKSIFKLRQALGDADQSLVKTVHGYGYRLMAPVSVAAPATVEPDPRFEFAVGSPPPLRPLWRLEKRLGAGGHGEAWLARHGKTGESRVYKYAQGGASLTALKREITVSRLLRETYGERTDFVRLIDWNLDRPPYFIEAEYVPQGNLVQWAAAQGGIGQVPLETRLDLLAQAAEAVAAAHSVGVLHKDLKPANVLIQSTAGEPPSVKLGDFGSGTVLDPVRLAALGITRLGFTQTLATNSSASGTLHYAAPEVLAGQPPTAQADVYALGVMLYQLVAGDLESPMAPGWEHDVDDALLREDIARAADGRPARRLADAAALALRLRSLDARRAGRAAEQTAQAELEHARAAELQAQRNLERLRARRSWMFIAIGILVLGLGATQWLYQQTREARNQALASAATANAVSTFLNNDLLASANPGEGPTADLKVKDMLDRASAMVDQRFAGEPAAAARVHYSLAQSYDWLSMPGVALVHARQALDLFQAVGGRQSEDSLSAIILLAQITMRMADVKEALTLSREALAVLQSRPGAPDTRVLDIEADIARAQWQLGDYRKPLEIYADLVARARGAVPAIAPMRVNEWKRWQGWLHAAAGDFEAAETVLREMLDERIRLIGADHMSTTIARYNLGRVLTQRGRYAEADALLVQVLEAQRQWFGDRHARVAYALWALGELRLEQGRVSEANALLDEAFKRQLAVFGPNDQDSAWLSYLLAQTYQQQGRLAAARDALVRGLTVEDEMDGPAHPMCIGARVDLAGVLREMHKPDEAWAVLKAIPEDGLRNLPDQHPFLANLRREQGLLWAQAQQYELSRAALGDALQIYQRRYGPAHWRTVRTREELATANRASARGRS